MKKILETERLHLRELNVNDAEYFYLLNLDKEVMKYTGEEPFKNIEKAKYFLKNYDHYEKYGFGRWAVINK
jgi:RimJ/RimL family protein N-acetyltransferase